LAAGPRLHLTDGNTEGVRAEAERATEPLEEGEGRGRVVAQAVEDVREREIRRRAVPACPPQAGPLERRAQCVGGEVEEVLARLEVVPEAAERARLQAAYVRGNDVNEATRHEESTDGGERRNWIGHVLDRVVQRDDVEARGGKVEIFDP